MEYFICDSSHTQWRYFLYLTWPSNEINRGWRKTKGLLSSPHCLLQGIKVCLTAAWEPWCITTVSTKAICFIYYILEVHFLSVRLLNFLPYTAMSLMWLGDWPRVLFVNAEAGVYAKWLTFATHCLFAAHYSKCFIDVIYTPVNRWAVLSFN